MRPSWGLCIGVLSLLAGCERSGATVGPSASAADASRASDSQSAPREAAAGFATVPLGTRLRIAPNDDAPAFVSTGFAQAGWPAAAQAYKVLGEADGFVALQSLGGSPAGNHCSHGHDGHDDFQLRWYVKRADLGLVIKKRTTQRFDDGTELEVQAGSGLVAGDEAGVFAVNAAGLAVALELTPDHVGKFYDTGPALTPKEHVGALPRGAVLRGQVGPVHGTRALAGSYESLHVYSHEKHGSGSHLLTFANACVKIAALSTVAPHLIKKEGEAKSLVLDEAGKQQMFGMGGLGFGGTARGGAGLIIEHVVASGATVFWPDGSEGGRLSAPHVFSAEPSERGAHKCFPLPGATESPDALRVCFEEGSVTKAPRGEGVGRLGGEGTLGRGYGRGYGRDVDVGAPGQRVPRVRQAKATVAGPLDRDIIRRIVRHHINEVRHCYNQVLQVDPTQQGRVEIRFEIDAAGKVSSAKVESTTFASGGPGVCMAKVARRWKFPKPVDGKTVTVTYPFIFSPG